MHIHIEMFAIEGGHAHGAIWLENGTAIPISMLADAYHTAIENGLFQRTYPVNQAPDKNAVINESNRFYNFIGWVEEMSKLNDRTPLI